MPSKDANFSTSSSDASELETRFVPQENDAETLWEVIEITAEKGNSYRVKWAGDDPKTKKPWPQSWVSKDNCTDALVQHWKKEKKQRSRNKKDTKRAWTASKRSKVLRESHVSRSSSSTLEKLPSLSGPSSPLANRKRSHVTANMDQGDVYDAIRPKKRRKVMNIIVSTPEAECTTEDGVNLEPKFNESNPKSRITSDIKGIVASQHSPKPESPKHLSRVSADGSTDDNLDYFDEVPPPPEHLELPEKGPSLDERVRDDTQANRRSSSSSNTSSTSRTMTRSVSRNSSQVLARASKSSSPPKCSSFPYRHIRDNDETPPPLTSALSSTAQDRVTNSKGLLSPVLSPAALDRLREFDGEILELEKKKGGLDIEEHAPSHIPEFRSGLPVNSPPGDAVPCQRQMASLKDSYRREIIPETDAESSNNTQSQPYLRGLQRPVSPHKVPSIPLATDPSGVVDPTSTSHNLSSPHRSVGSIVSKMKPRPIGNAYGRISTSTCENEELYDIPEISETGGRHNENLSPRIDAQTVKECNEEMQVVREVNGAPRRVIFKLMPQPSPSTFTANIPTVTKKKSGMEMVDEEHISSIEQSSSPEGRMSREFKSGKIMTKVKDKGKEQGWEKINNSETSEQGDEDEHDSPLICDELARQGKQLGEEFRRRKRTRPPSQKVILKDLSVTTASKDKKGRQEPRPKYFGLEMQIQNRSGRLSNRDEDESESEMQNNRDENATSSDVEESKCRSKDRILLRQEEEESTQDLGLAECSESEMDVGFTENEPQYPEADLVMANDTSSETTNPEYLHSAGKMETVDATKYMRKRRDSVNQTASEAADQLPIFRKTEELWNKEKSTWENERAKLITSIISLTRRKESLEKDVEFFREQYNRASTFVSTMRAENGELEKRARIAEEQATTGVQSIKELFQERLRSLEDDKKSLTRMAHFIITKDERTNDEVRKRAAEEPQLRLRIGELEKENKYLRKQNVAFQETLKNQEILIAEIELESDTRGKGLERFGPQVARVTSRAKREDADDMVFRCQWRPEVAATDCTEIFRTVEELLAHLYNAGHLGEQFYRS